MRDQLLGKIARASKEEVMPMTVEDNKVNDLTMRSAAKKERP